MRSAMEREDVLSWVCLITLLLLWILCLHGTLALRKKLPPLKASFLRGGLLLFAASFLLVLLLRIAAISLLLDPEDPYAAFEDRKGAQLVAVSAQDGNRLSGTPLACPPVFDGMIAASGRLFASLRDGTVVSLARVSHQTSAATP